MCCIRFSPSIKRGCFGRYLQRRELADQYLADMGRQRAFKLVAKCFKHSNTMMEKLNAEKEKMEELRAGKRAASEPEPLTDPLQTPEPSPPKKIKSDGDAEESGAGDEVMVEVTPGSYPAPRTLSVAK